MCRLYEYTNFIFAKRCEALILKICVNASQRFAKMKFVPSFKALTFKLNKSIMAFLTICLFFLPVQSQAKIVETHCFADVLSEVDQNTLVFFDIDDTLINTTSMLGNTPCWRYLVSTISKSNLPLDKVRPHINAVIQKILRKVPMGLIDPCASEVVRKLQLQGILAFALTARCLKVDYMPAADYRAYEHLKSVGIDFTLTPMPKNIDADTSRFFSYGIIFTDYQEKGPFLKAFLQNLDLHPAKIVFIDDSAKQMKSVENVVEQMGIPFAGFRFGKLDNFHAQFDPLIVNIQLEALLKHDRVLSDEEAGNIAQINSDLDPHYFINELIQAWHAD